MMPRTAPMLPLLLALTAAPAWADENKDLELIPESVRTPTERPAAEEPTRDLRQRIYLENALTLNSFRTPVVAPPPPAGPDWQERLFLDGRKEWLLGAGTTLSLSNRLNLQAEDRQNFPTRQTVRNEFREGFVSWQASPGDYLDAGRINVKSGVAAGFNPTDFFKTRAVVEPLSADPAVLREDRLGTVMVTGQHIGEGGSVLAAFAPAFYSPSRVYTPTTLPSFNPMFDRTNAHDRLLLKGSAKIVGDLSPELLVYHEGNQTELGANLAEGVGQSTILYAEWAGGPRTSLIADALRYGVDTGTIPGNAPNVLPFDPRRHFQNDLSAGASYTTEAKVVFNVEYHFHQAGFSPQDWRNWFATGTSALSTPPVRAELWFIRGYAAEQQEPTATHAAFVRVDWVDAFVPHLELTAFASIDLHDGSTLTQATADYALSDTWSIGALVAATFGRARSSQGSLPQSATAILKIARYY
jgi:hypothetical protein